MTIRDAADAVDNVILTTAAVWLALTYVGVCLLIVNTFNELTYPNVALITLLVIAGIWWMCLIRRAWPPPLLVAAIVTVTIVTVMVSAPLLDGAVFPVVGVWLQLAVTAAAALLTRRHAAIVILTTTAAAFTLMTARHISGVNPLDVFVVAFDAAAIGMAITAGVYGLRRVAHDTDIQAEADAEADADVLIDQARADEEFRWACLVHDTAINTLGAVATGLPTSAAPVVARRAQHDLDILTATPPREQHPPAPGDHRHYNTLAAYAEQRGATLDLNVTVTYTTATTPEPPERVLDALSACVDEALLNVAKHSGVNHADVHIGEHVTGVTVTITDHGHGIATTTSRHKPVALARRAHNGGLRVHVTSTTPNSPNDDTGVTVTVTWLAADTDTGTTARTPRILVSALVPMVVHVTAWLYTLYLAETLILQTGQGRLLTGTALGVSIVLTIVLLIVTNRTRAVPGPLAAIAILAVPVVTIAPAIDLAGCATTGPQFWGPNTGVVLAVTIMLLVNKRWATIAAITTYITTVVLLLIDTNIVNGPCENTGLVRLVTNCGIITAAWLLLRYLNTYGRHYEQTRAAAAAAEADRIRYQQAAAVRYRRAQTMLGVATSLLTDIAAGAPINDPRLQAQCAAEESFLRSMLAIPTTLSPVADAVAAAAAAGRQSGVPVTITVNDSVNDLAGADTDGLNEMLTAAINNTPAGTPVTIAVTADTTTGHDPGLVITLAERHHQRSLRFRAVTHNHTTTPTNA